MHRFLLPFVCFLGFQMHALAEWVDLPWSSLNATLPIWKPDDFDASKKYPAIVYYHGTGGDPNAAFVHEVTGGKGFVLVGMAYRKHRIASCCFSA